MKPANADDGRAADIENRLNAVTNTLNQTQQLLEQSMQEIRRLRGELETLRSQASTKPSFSGVANPGTLGAEPASAASSSVSTKEDMEALHEEQDALQAEIKQHEQTKVETTSKYPVRISGLVLFNAFSNAGVVDDAELPVLALPRNPGSSHGSSGASLRQTLLALEATGPRIGGARSAAEVSIDFFGGVSSNTYGYSNSQGSVRMRQSKVSLDWDKTTAEAGYTVPLFSPLSPTSYTTVAQPALSGSGNLWMWSPQIRVEQRIPLSDRSRVGLEAGLISPPSPNYVSTQLDTPVEASRRPGYEGRVSYRVDSKAGTVSRPFVLGIGAYSASQFYHSSTQIHSWAVTADWQIPLSQHLELSGEAYRGRALGGFGGSTYKDVLTGTDPVSGANRTVGLDSVGGWSQLKVRFTPSLEANGMFGMDNAFASNFDSLVLSTTDNPLQLYARNQSVVGNLIFRPKTYLIFSPEYRRIKSWRYTGPANVADIFSLSAGFQF
ncbi:hypothetical protein [Granulicella sp. dw_53]|uniref:hypothetical protein n=1 Tax=Granulicella sp. dw_53 TaxID=2719792 RepID=UPI001BD4BA55|nr:hypothetical protein [Granulicella sp. dw_53]